MTDKQQFVILGTGGLFTYHVIQTLIQQNTLPLAYIQAGKELQQRQATFAEIKLEVNKSGVTLFQLLETNNIPIVFQSQIELVTFIQQLNVEFLLVACWPELLTQEVLHSVSEKALNLHPSLLPKFRGIDPVADQLKQQDNNFGVSLHLLNESFDAGDIVLQQTLEIQKYLVRENIEIEAAQKGADLFIRAIDTYQEPGWELVSQDFTR